MPLAWRSALSATRTIAVEISPLVAASSSLIAEKSLALALMERASPITDSTSPAEPGAHPVERVRQPPQFGGHLAQVERAEVAGPEAVGGPDELLERQVDRAHHHDDGAKAERERAAEEEPQDGAALLRLAAAVPAGRGARTATASRRAAAHPR